MEARAMVGDELFGVVKGGGGQKFVMNNQNVAIFGSEL